MRQLLLLVLLATPLLNYAEEPSVDILGVAIKKGMTESHLRSVLPFSDCVKYLPAADQETFACPVGDDTQSGAGGNVLFEKGVVIQASRTWLLPEDTTPFDLAIMLNKTITRLIGDERAVCTKMESSPGVTYSPEGIILPEGTPSTEIRSGSTINPASTSFVFPEKVLTITMHTFRGERVVMTESLRQNPVPKHYKVEGDKYRGSEWCGYVN